jgi:MFS family permease
VLSTFAFAAVSVGFNGYAALSNSFISETNLTFTDSAWMMSSFAIAYAVMQIPAGLFSDKFGGKKILVVAVITLTVSSFLFLISNNFQMAIASRLLMGASGGLVLPAAIRTLSLMFHPSDLSRATGILGTGWGLGLTLSFVVIPSIISTGWRSGVFFITIFTLIIALATVSFLSLKKPAIRVSAQTQYRFKELFQKRILYAILINFTLVGVLTNITTWAPMFLNEELKIPLVTSGVISATIGLAGIISSFAGGVMAKRFGDEIIIIISMLMCLFFPFLLAFSSTSLLAFAIIFMIGWATFFCYGPILALVTLSVREENAGAAFGFFNSLSFIGAFAYPLITGPILDMSGHLELSFYATGLIAIVGVMASILISKSKKS